MRADSRSEELPRGSRNYEKQAECTALDHSLQVQVTTRGDEEENV